MKKTLTLLVFLFICFKISAAAGFIDTSKTARDTSKANSKDTAKLQAEVVIPDSAAKPVAVINTDSLDFTLPSRHKNNFTLAAIGHFPDGLNFSMPVNHQENYSLQAVTFYPDSLNLTSFAKHTDSVSLSLTHITDNYNRLQITRNADSLRLLAALVRQDSLKFLTYRVQKDSVQQRLSTMGTDSLKLQLKNRMNDIFKGQIYNEIATRYMDYDTISNKFARYQYQNRALSYTMLALHQYSYFNDTTGLRVSFDHLAKVYMSQKKFSQAKWFILQSNSLSRAKNDQPNVIASLITLSAIKNELNDYTLAMRDLNEALQISVTYKYPKLQSLVLKNYALLYSRLKNYPKEEAVLKKRDSLEESIRKDEESRLMANVAAKDSVDKKKTDSVQVKKKVLSSNTKKLYKNNSPKKAAS